MLVETTEAQFGFFRKVTWKVAAVTTDGHPTTGFQTLLTSPWFTFPLAMLCPPTGKRLGFTTDSGKFHNVSLGQGQEMVAEMALEKASRGGHWVILQVSNYVFLKTLGVNTDGQCRAPLPSGNEPFTQHTVICCWGGMAFSQQ